MTMISGDLVKELLNFRHLRDWEQFHTPRNLAAALTIEAAELLECFQWATDAEIPELTALRRGKIEDELADVAILMAYLCVDIGVDIDAAVRRKLLKNEAKYPVHLSKGNAKKYDEL